MSSIFALQKMGGKTNSLDALCRDTFRDQLSACFKAGSDRASNFNRTCSYQALMFSIASMGQEPIPPSYELLCLISEGFFAYRDIHCYSDTATLSIRKLLGPYTQFFVYDIDGLRLTAQDDLCSAYYVVIAWDDLILGHITSFDERYNMGCVVCVPSHAAIYELKRSFDGLASIQLFEDAEAFGRGFRNVNPAHGFIRMGSTERLFETTLSGPVVLGNLAQIGVENDAEAARSRSRWMADLMKYYPAVSIIGSDLDIADRQLATDKVKMRNQGMRDRQVETISSYLHYIDYIFSTEEAIVNEELGIDQTTKEWIGVLKSSVFDPINLITQSDRCFLESASGFKYINVPGLDSGAIFAAITSAFLLGLMANNRSEVFMSYVPYGPKDILTNGEFDLGGYVNGSMWFEEEGPQEHKRFRELSAMGKTWYGALKISSRKAGNREKVIDVVRGTCVIGNKVMLDVNEEDNTYLYDKVDSSKTNAPGVLNGDNWRICHGHAITNPHVTTEDLYGPDSEENPEPSESTWHKLSLEQDKDGVLKIPAYLMAGKL